MALSTTRKRWLIVLGALIIVLVILSISANRILSNKAESILREQLENVELKNQLIDFEKVRVNVWTRSVSITGITLRPDSTALEKVRRSKLAKPVLEINLQKLRILGIKIIKAVKGNGFSFGSIALEEPQIVMYGNGSPFKGKGQDNGDGNIFSSDSVSDSPLKEISLKSFIISDVNFDYIDLDAGNTLIEVSGLEIMIENVSMHPHKGGPIVHALEMKDVVISMDSCMMELPDGFYTMKTGELRMSYADGSFSLDSFEMIPAYSKGTFGKKFGKQTDRFDITAGNITIEGIQFDSLLTKKFIADEIMLSSPHADICRDKRVARDMSIFPKLFQTSLAQLPIEVYVPSIRVTNAMINYQEIVKESNEPGGVIIDDLDMSITGACNYADSIKNGQALLVDAKGMLMGKSEMQVHFYLPVGNHAEYFTFHGSTAPFPATNLNPLLAPLAFVEATNGTINSTRFYAMAMNDTTVGRLEFKYQDLNVAVLKKSQENKGSEHENKFLSFLARTAIHKNNPHANKPVRIARMSFTRDRNKGFFNYVWKTIQNGLITTLTPGKKKLANEMDWNEFSSKWRKVLLDDWNELQAKKAKKNK